jgi:hypothetical protein
LNNTKKAKIELSMAVNNYDQGSQQGSAEEFKQVANGFFRARAVELSLNLAAGWSAWCEGFGFLVSSESHRIFIRIV